MLRYCTFSSRYTTTLGGGGWGGGVGWGMLTFMGLAHLRDATLLHVLFKVYNYVGGWGVGWGGGVGDVNVHGTCTLTWCYATARSLQGIQLRWRVGGWGGVVGWGMLTFMGLAHLRDATLLHVLFKVYNYVMLRYCTFSSSYTTTWCYVHKLFFCTCALLSCYVAVAGGCWGCVSMFFLWFKDIYPRCSFLHASNA